MSHQYFRTRPEAVCRCMCWRGSTQDSLQVLQSLTLTLHSTVSALLLCFFLVQSSHCFMLLPGDDDGVWKSTEVYCFPLIQFSARKPCSVKIYGVHKDKDGTYEALMSLWKKGQKDFVKVGVMCKQYCLTKSSGSHLNIAANHLFFWWKLHYNKRTSLRGVGVGGCPLHSSFDQLMSYGSQQKQLGFYSAGIWLSCSMRLKRLCAILFRLHWH